jgi:hypothetical protein
MRRQTIRSRRILNTMNRRRPPVGWVTGTDEHERTAAMVEALTGGVNPMTKERTFTMRLTPMGISSRVLLDGEDISGLLYGVTVRSDADGATSVELHARGASVDLEVKLPEAQVVVYGQKPEA